MPTRLAKKNRRRLRRVMRPRAYAWLAHQLGLGPGECHIALFDRATCERVVEVCRGVTSADVRRWWYEEGGGDGELIDSIVDLYGSGDGA
jgi:sigma54-dependent transcription regulator